MEWQPIETAPKDGTRVILADISIRERPVADVGLWTGRWWEDTYGGEIKAIAWMPLPPPPDTPSQDGRVQSSKTSTELDAALKFLPSKT